MRETRYSARLRARAIYADVRYRTEAHGPCAYRPCMRVLRVLMLLGSLFTAPAMAGPTAPQVERNAVELKQGMTTDEVQKLLGKPKRTAFRSNSIVQATPATLQWTYTFGSASSTERVLQIVFVAKAPEEWAVESWAWPNSY